MTPFLVIALIVSTSVAILALSALAWYCNRVLTQQRTDHMAVSAAAQALVDELNGAATTLTTALADASTSATAQSAEDLAAIKTAADALVAAITAAATPPAS